MLYLFIKKIYFFKGCSAVVGMLVDIGVLMRTKIFTCISLCVSSTQILCVSVCQEKLLSPFFMPTFGKVGIHSPTPWSNQRGKSASGLTSRKSIFL